MMVWLVGTAAYIGSMTLIHEPHPGWFFTLTNHHPAFTNADQFLGTVGGAKGADQRESPAGTSCWYSAHAAVGETLVESSEMM